MRITLEDNNPQENSPDGDILNPQVKNQTDMTRKELRLLEKEKLKNMGFGKKLEYIWMYYKAAILGIVLVIFLIFTGVSIYQNAQIKTILTLYTVNSSMYDSEALSQEIAQELGADDATETVYAGGSLVTEANGTQLDYYSQMAFVTKLQAKEIDVMVMPESLYNNLEKEEIFADMKELLGEETYSRFGDDADTYCLRLNDNALAQKLETDYEPLCITVMVNSDRKDWAVKWIETLL